MKTMRTLSLSLVAFCAASALATGLPAEYTRVAGLQSAGVAGSNAPYIDLGYKPTEKTWIDLEFNVLGWGSGAGLDDYPCPFGVCHQNNALAFTLTGGAGSVSQNHWRFRWANGSSEIAFGQAKVEGYHNLEACGFSWTVDGNVAEKTGGASETFTMTQNFYVFARNNNGVMDHPVKMVLYGFDIYENGVLRHSFVPCVRKSDDEPGLYDVVGDKGFLEKSGTGAFTVVESSLRMESVPSVVSFTPYSPQPIVHPTNDSSTVLAECVDYRLIQGMVAKDGVTNRYVVAQGIGAYAGWYSEKSWYRVVAQAANAFSVGQIAPVAYNNGSPCTPRPIVRPANGSGDLAEGADYDLTWYNNRDVGRGYVVISGRGSFAGQFWTEPFWIVPQLPDGYSVVEYIRSSGTQYINTGFKPDVNTSAHLILNMEEFGGTADFASPFGSRNANSRQFFVGAARQPDASTHVTRDDWFRRLSGTSIEAGIIAGGVANYRGKPSIVGEHFISLDKAIYTIDGYSAVFSFYTSFSKAYDAYAFAVNNNNAATQLAPMKLYSLKIWDDGVPVRNFVPCVNKDGIAGLYDMTPGASKVFYTNDGSGDFEAGPVLIPEEGAGTVIYLI
ncbi:MAG: hypothetical protein IKC15_06160 [Kiritimatiellae bacterium]|nr:hypothetical protein [Kiritimatiellia bacterium]